MSKSTEILTNSSNFKKDVSVVVAIRNEEKYIRKCLDSLINQDLPHSQYEIIVVDGLSDDQTNSIIESYQQRYPHLIRIFSNPMKTSPNGRNIGIQNSQSEWIFVFGGHCKATNNLLSTLVNCYQNADKDIAGIGTIHTAPSDENFLGKVISEVQTSFIGGMGTTFINNGKRRYIDSSAFTIYRKDVLYEIGLHDIRLTVGQDMDLNWRIRKAGYKLVLCPDAIVYYYRRHASFYGLSKRMINYGKWKAIFYKSYPKSFKPVFVVPSLIFIAIISLPILSLLSNFLYKIDLLLLLIYIIMLTVNSILISIKGGSIAYLLSFPITIIEHIGFGFGFLIGLFHNMNKFKASDDNLLRNAT